MDMVTTVDNRNDGFRVEGDLGDLQIIEEDSSSDDEDCDVESESPGSGVLANIPSSLIKANTAPVIGAVQVTNSDNVQFGNNTYFNGPVVIKQVIQSSSGVDNMVYEKNDEESDPNSHNQYQNSKVEPSTFQKYQIKTWHKMSLSVVSVIILGSICAIVVVIMQRSDKDNGTISDSRESSEHDQVTVCHSELVGTTHLTILLSILIVGITYILYILHSLLLTNGERLMRRGGDGHKFYVENLETIREKHTTVTALSKREDNLLIAPDHLRIVPRTDWLAQPVEDKIDVIKQPVPWVIITHTATESCSSQSECVLRVRLIQMFHVESRGWSDIGYNFLVAGDGSAYFGRGWDQVGAHTKGYNKYAISIAFIGTFNSEKPPDKQIDACRKLLKLGVAEGKLAKDYILLGHRQLMSTLSPGDKLYDIIKTWPHFYNGTDITSIIPKNY